jgi:L-fucose mutarotase
MGGGFYYPAGGPPGYHGAWPLPMEGRTHFKERIMLKGIPTIISPELMSVLLSMGHGDELVIADGNFPASSMARRLLRADGHGVPPLLDAIMRFFPLDAYVPHPVALMAVVPGDTAKTVIWNEYRDIIRRHDPGFGDFELVERFAFYERAQRAYAILATSESAIYANVILKKGIVKPA